MLQGPKQNVSILKGSYQNISDTCVCVCKSGKVQLRRMHSKYVKKTVNFKRRHKIKKRPFWGQYADTKTECVCVFHIFEFLSQNAVSKSTSVAFIDKKKNGLLTG